MIPARGKAAVHTGLAIHVPHGTYGRVAPRSGLAAKHFIDVGAGVIDEDYRGEVLVLLFNHGEADFKGAQWLAVGGAVGPGGGARACCRRGRRCRSGMGACCLRCRGHVAHVPALCVRVCSAAAMAAMRALPAPHALLGAAAAALHRRRACAVRKGDRIAQLVLEAIVTPEVEVVEELDDTSRGAGGFGSTGVSAGGGQ